MIVIEPCAGLGNRLLALSSANKIAEQLGRPLVVLWKREVGCNAKASELFSLPMEVVEVSENGYSKEPFAYAMGNRIKKKWRKKAERFLESGDVDKITREQGYGELLRVIENTGTIYLKAFGPLCEIDAAAFTFLKPSKSVLEKGKPLFSRLSAGTVGVHIRRTDHTEAIANSPLSLFTEVMERELKHGEKTVFFVATDDGTVKEELREKFAADKLIFHEKGIIDRNSGAGIADALIEMLALSRCKKIIGSYNSTFGLIASYLGDIPLEIVKKPG